jgi:hypothetical protein
VQCSRPPPRQPPPVTFAPARTPHQRLCIRRESIIAAAPRNLPYLDRTTRIIQDPYLLLQMQASTVSLGNGSCHGSGVQVSATPSRDEIFIYNLTMMLAAGEPWSQPAQACCIQKLSLCLCMLQMAQKHAKNGRNSRLVGGTAAASLAPQLSPTPTNMPWLDAWFSPTTTQLHCSTIPRTTPRRVHRREQVSRSKPG